MINDKGILIKNIYYMLSYAFQVLKQNNYEEIAGEDFDHIENLFAEILCKGISRQLKQGLYRSYVPKSDDLPLLRGKLEINGTIQHRLRKEQKLSCEFDEYSENNLYNQIVKTTANKLIHTGSVTIERRGKLHSLMLFFGEVDEIEPEAIPWTTLQFLRNNRNYEMLLNMCYFVLVGLIQTTEQGNHKVLAFRDDHMHALYERFVREYYREHYPHLDVSAKVFDWNLDKAADTPLIQFLPKMNTDITLQDKASGRVLIIDTKYYGKTMQSMYDKQIYHSGNMYQIYAYVKNADTEHTGNVSGMLLYAKTEEKITPNATYQMDGNQISVKTLDLNQEFSGIRKDLDMIVEELFLKMEDGYGV